MTDHASINCAETSYGENRSTLLQRTISFLKLEFGNALANYRHRRQLRIDRAAFQHMRSLSDDILDDIGVTRSNVEWASQLPIHQSAARALESTMKRARPRIRP